MNSFELVRLREASGLFTKLLGQVNQYLTRTYPNVGRRGSQLGEDEVLAELLPGAEGVYVDFGAAEPVECSNTWQFYQRGWRGLLIEPLWWYWPALLHQRPGDFLYDAAVREYTGVAALRINGTLSSVLSSWNTESECSVLVPCETASEVLAKFPAIRDNCRLCSIDVEGAEREVLSGIDWKEFQPEVFCVEFRAYDPVKVGEDISGEWIDILLSQGYQEVARTDLNIIFQKEEQPHAG